MTNPTDKHDILDALLTGSPEDTSEVLEILDKMIHRQAPPPQQSSTETKPPPAGKKKPTPKSLAKKKSTHYLSDEIFHDLDEAKARINRVIQDHHKQHITKSKIVDQALKMILKEFEEKGVESPLIHELLKEIAKR